MERPADPGTRDDMASRASIAVLTALPHEQAAMKCMLDNASEYSTQGNAPGEYIVGTIPSKEGGVHVVVLGRCGVAQNFGAANATILLERFPSINTVIVVGIAGGVPDPHDPDYDIRLGDVVVCNADGVIQYDYDKETLRDGSVTSEPRHPPRPPSPRLMVACEDLRVAELEGRRPWEQFFERADLLPWARRPTEEDHLHDHTEPATIVPRIAPKRVGTPRVFAGRIASGNKLLKNVLLRERLRTSFRVKAVEMEASGVADASWLQRAGYFVVRGICDYCDQFKNDAWQGYAAMVASAYTRALLMQTRSSAPTSDQSGRTRAITLDAFPPPLLDALLKAVDPSIKEALSAALSELAEANRGISVRYDAAWPNERPWADLVVQALQDTIAVNAGEYSLSAGELFLALSVPHFASIIWKRRTLEQFREGITPDELADTLRELYAVTPRAETLDLARLGDSGSRLVARWSVLRLLRAQRKTWPDDLFRLTSADVSLSRWLAADPLVCSLVRAVAGDRANFEVLPHSGPFRFLGNRFEIRWRTLACLLSVAELRVLGADLLPEDVVEHAAQLKEVADSVEHQLSDAIIASDSDGNWLVTATCDEPVLDHALTQIAENVHAELHSVRSYMSSHLAASHGPPFPTVRADLHIKLINGRPRFTRPHLRFALSAEHARRLFMGADLWGDHSFAFRELFQNALDACRYRAARSRFLGIPYAPAIRMHQGIDGAGREFVECEDNGIGMDRDVLASSFSTAGRRFVDSDEFRRERNQWRHRGISVRTNSQFGIGVFSYFLVAEEVEIETARLTTSGRVPSERVQLRIPTASSFFRVVTLSEEQARDARSQGKGAHAPLYLDAGTRVRLFLRRRDQTDSMSSTPIRCVEALQEHVWFSEVPLHATDDRGSSYLLGPHVLPPSLALAVPGGPAEPQLWWLKGYTPYRAGEPTTTFRSRKRGRNGVEHYDHPGRILVDGLVTDVVTPGFVINLSGELTPELSLDRLKIRSDVSEIIVRRVSEALEYLPDEVSEEVFSDLWHWDPRACLGATRAFAKSNKAWVRRSFVEGGFDGLGHRVPRRVTEPFFPKHSINPTFDEYRKSLFELWLLARRTPDAVAQSPTILERRGVSYELRRHLATVPRLIWDALGALNLDTRHACALEYGIERAKGRGVVAFMSWLSGEPLDDCERELAKVLELLDLPRTESPTATRATISDYDAWLISHGTFGVPWHDRGFDTWDLILMARNSEKPIQKLAEEYEALANKLDTHSGVNLDLACNVGALTDSEARRFSMMRAGHSWPGDNGDDTARAQLLYAAAGLGPAEPEPSNPSTSSVDSLSEADRLVLREIRSAAPGLRPLTLAAVSQVARRVERSLLDVTQDVRRIAPMEGRTCHFDDASVATVSAFSEMDWRLAVSRTTSILDSGHVAAHSRISLARELRGSNFLMRQQYGTAKGVHARLTDIHAMFGWGAIALNEDEIESALSLTKDQLALIQHSPASGLMSIPRLIYTTIRCGLSIPAAAASLEGLAMFGIRGPSPGHTYLGVRWEDLEHP